MGGEGQDLRDSQQKLLPSQSWGPKPVSLGHIPPEAPEDSPLLPCASFWGPWRHSASAPCPQAPSVLSLPPSYETRGGIWDTPPTAPRNPGPSPVSSVASRHGAPDIRGEGPCQPPPPAVVSPVPHSGEAAVTRPLTAGPVLPGQGTGSQESQCPLSALCQWRHLWG